MVMFLLVQCRTEGEVLDSLTAELTEEDLEHLKA